MKKDELLRKDYVCDEYGNQTFKVEYEKGKSVNAGMGPEVKGAVLAEIITSECGCSSTPDGHIRAK